MSDKTTSNIVQTILVDTYKINIVKDVESKYFWEVIATSNGQSIGHSEQAFSTHTYCLDHAKKLGTIMSSPAVQTAEKTSETK